jgi:hypothetical protein
VTYNFGDGFDLYATAANGADMATGYWDSTLGGVLSVTSAGRFPGGRSLGFTNTQNASLVKASNVNDAVHHIFCSMQYAAALAGSSLGVCFQLFDGATAQCTINFRSDGAIVLASGGPTGTVLATYFNAFPVANTWYGFEFEIVINATAGSFAVRRNGNTVNDFSATGLNTQVSANAYANKLQLGAQATGGANYLLDDFFWRSGASAGSWLGEMRCATMMPTSDQSVVFSRSPTTFTLSPFSTSSANTGGIAAAVGRYNGFVSQGGSVASVAVTLVAGYTGNLKCAIFACVGSTLGATNSVGAILGAATAAIANPVTGVNTFSFSPAVSIPYGTLFYVGICSDTTAGSSIAQSTATPTSQYAATSNTAYASFPTASPTLASTLIPNFNVTPAFTSANFLLVNEPQQDGLATYVYDSNPGDQDFYGLNPLVPTGASVIAATTRAYMQKSDVGTRTAAVKLKSGATTVAAPTLTLTTSGWQWDWRTDLVDPNTSAAWTVAAVNGAQIGPTVVA